MAVISNTYVNSSGSGKQNRETIITDMIENLDPTETPLFKLIGKESVDGVKPEWLYTSLSTPVITNAQLEGDQYTYAAINQPARVSNYTQIARKEGIVSKSQDAVSKVGQSLDSVRAKLEKGIELRRDIEASLLSNNASVAGSTRQSGGLRAWLATNDIIAAGGASGGFNSGTGVVDAATPGTTQRAFTKVLMDDALMAAYGTGGAPTIGMMSIYNKRTFSSFMSDASVAQQRMATSPSKQAAIVGAADVYLSDWGQIDVVPNRIMTLAGAAVARNVFFLQPDKLSKGFLREIQEDKNIAPNADATPFVIICEYTLVMKNEKAHAVVADTFGLTSST